MRRVLYGPLHPLLFAAAFVLQPAALNGVEPPGFVRPLLVAVVAAGVAVSLARLAAGSWARAGMVATLLLALVVSREPWIWFVTTLRDALGTGTAVMVIAVLLIVAIWCVIVLVRSRLRAPPGWLPWTTRALNIFGLVLVAGALVVGGSTTTAWLGGFGSSAREGAPAGERLPDIYVLLLDGYARDDVLQREFGYDNRPFLEELQDLGFAVDRSSNSNYTYSALTFTSLLEVGYVRDGSSGSVHDSELRDRLHAALRHGRAANALHQAGYEMVGTAGGWEHDSFRGRVDRFLDRPELTDFERQSLQRTWLLDLPLVPANLFFGELHKRVEGVLADAVALAAEAGRAHPVFGFMHVPAPHLPMAFAADGGPPTFPSRLYGAGRPSEFGLTDAEYAAAYVASIEQLNERVLESIRGIQAAAARRGAPQPAIVVLSDHGYIGDEPVHGPDKLANLFAWLLPEAARQTSEFPTPVNLVPALLSAYLEDPGVEPVPNRFFTTLIRGQTLDLTEIPRPERDAK